jgi:hypothetical protein
MSVSMLVAGCPATSVMMSPTWMPAFAVGPPGHHLFDVQSVGNAELRGEASRYRGSRSRRSTDRQRRPS